MHKENVTPLTSANNSEPSIKLMDRVNMQFLIDLSFQTDTDRLIEIKRELANSQFMMVIFDFLQMREPVKV